MYDFPDARAATDAWWRGIAAHLRHAEFSDVPQQLTRGNDLFEEWRAPRLLMSQTCGYILTSKLSADAQVIATPHYSAPGCHGPNYASVLLKYSRHGGSQLSDFRGANAVYSLEYSHAGYNAFRAAVAPLAQGAAFFRRVSSSGSHLDSIGAVASGCADIATVDCIVYAFVQRHRPDALENTQVLGYTAAAPAPPYITSRFQSTETVDRLRATLRAAVDDPALAAVRGALFIEGFSFAEASHYDHMTQVELNARGMHYPELR